MLKRISLCIISMVMAATMLCGCSFFVHDTERDYRQVAATVGSYTINNSLVEVDDDGETHVTPKTYTTTEKTIYKRDLVEYVYNNASSLQQSFSSAQAMYKYAIEMLVNLELVINEVDALIDAGIVEWGLTETNAVKKRIYSAIDSNLISIQNQILESRDKPQISTSGDSDVSTDTTYPVKPDDEDDSEDVKDTEVWEPELSRYPGMHGDSERRSLEREAVNRFIALIKNRVKDDFRLTAEDKAKFAEDDERINEVIATQGIEMVYPILCDTHYMYYISGKALERSQKITQMQTYLTENSEVSDNDVIKSYTDTLNQQRSTYTNDISAYDTAMSDGSTTVLYHPNNNHFYVKHILLPFSDDQKAALADYKARLNVTKDQIEEFRDRLVSGIVCYPHVAGEDDKTRPMSVAQVLDEIRAKMLPLEGNSERADLMFDDLIYKYNTDSGAFGNNKGYVVKYKLNADESEKYMQEFADGARYMRDNLEVGQVYYTPVVTDYGVHIMYFASTVEVGSVNLYDYTTPGKVETYFDVIKAPLTTSRENAAYSKWESNVLSYNLDKYATFYESRYKDLWE